MPEMDPNHNVTDLRRQLAAAQAELAEAWDSIGEHPVGFELAACVESLKAQNESLTERVTKLKAELASARLDTARLKAQNEALIESIIGRKGPVIQESEEKPPSDEENRSLDRLLELAESASQNAENQRLRELLWMAWSNGMGYGDDGEMQFAGMDFKRDSLELLERKMYERNLPAVKAFLEARKREEPQCPKS
jgi:hypothetical protein